MNPFKANINEALKSFAKRGNSAVSDKFLQNRSGEGVENLFDLGYGRTDAYSWNTFFNKYINKSVENEIARIQEYRRIASCPEVADVIEDAVIESTREDDEGKILKLKIVDTELAKNSNIAKNLEKEFDDLFHQRIDINDKIFDMFKTFLIDGRVYLEKVINKVHPKNGIINIKKLPTETMDFIYDPVHGRIQAFFQYLTARHIKPSTIEEALNDKNIVVFYPEQISLVDYGIYGNSRNEIHGYLEKVRVPYNQMKLLETSVIIYRIIRAPERYVFKVDVGNMPRDKALKFVESVKRSMNKKQTYDPQSGRLGASPDPLSINENFFIPIGSDGRGSDISTIGGSSTAGFTNLDDLYYFSRKLYRALKYPQSRISAMESKQENSVLWANSPLGDISRDEVKWSVWLEQQQARFCNAFKDLFLLHLEFKGLKQQYNLNKSKISIDMTPPSDYKEKMKQHLREGEFANYTTLANYPEFSKYYLMKTYLNMTDAQIKENAKGLLKDKTLGLKPPELDQFGGGSNQDPGVNQNPNSHDFGGDQGTTQPEEENLLNCKYLI